MKQAVILAVFLYQSIWAMNGNLGNHDGYSPDGSETMPYRIEDLTDFTAYCQNTSYWNDGQHTELTTDLDLAGINYTSSPLGYYSDESFQFNAHLNGNNHTIYNYTGAVSMFATIGMEASVSNLNLSSISITITDPIGVGGLCNYLEGMIDKCSVTGQITGGYNDGYIPEYCAIGGLVAYSYGEMGGYSGTVKNSFSKLSMTITGTYYAGGIIANMTWGSSIINSFSNSTITANEATYIGGLVGFSQDSTISNSYSTGELSATWGTIGGFAGSFEYASRPIENCFWDTESTGQLTGYTDYEYTHDITGKTTDEMKMQSTFTNWDFTNIWVLSDSGSEYAGYPILRWQAATSSSYGVEDLALLAEYWLDNNCQSEEPCSRFDLNADTVINIKDFSKMAKSWDI